MSSATQNPVLNKLLVLNGGLRVNEVKQLQRDTKKPLVLSQEKFSDLPQKLAKAEAVCR